MRGKIALQFHSLRFRILLLLFVVGILPCIAVTQGFFQLYKNRSIESDVTDITVQVQQLSNRIITSGYLENNASKSFDRQLATMANIYSGRIMLVNNSLKIIKDTYGVDEGKTIVWDHVLKSAGGETLSYYDEDNQYLVVSVPIISKTGDEQEVKGVFLVNKPMDYMQQNIEYFQVFATVALLILYIVIIGISLFFTKRFTRPLQAMSHVMDEIQTGYGEDAMAVNDYTETAEISEKFNSLMSRLKIMDTSRQEFVSNVSHELKTPLASMKVLADSLNGQENVPLELYKEFMGDIGDEIDRETKIINDLLSMVKMDKSADSLNISPVNMNELLELILKRLRPIAERQEVELVYESFRPVTAEIDEVKLTLAISNLVENGIKYNHPGGWVHVSINADHQYCYIKVEDSGMGIPEDSLEKIFERFYRVDKSHSREIGGTGLGLAITRSAILMHRGAIKVHSTLGEGTVFDVRIPLNYIAKEERT